MLRIYFILMRVRIHPIKKWIRIRLLNISNEQMKNYRTVVFFFLLICLLKLSEPFRNLGIFVHLLLLEFLLLDPDPWFRIFLQIEFQEAKMLRIQRIRISSNDLGISIVFKTIYKTLVFYFVDKNVIFI